LRNWFPPARGDNPPNDQPDADQRGQTVSVRLRDCGMGTMRRRAPVATLRTAPRTCTRKPLTTRTPTSHNRVVPPASTTSPVNRSFRLVNPGRSNTTSTAPGYDFKPRGRRGHQFNLLETLGVAIVHVAPADPNTVLTRSDYHHAFHLTQRGVGEPVATSNTAERSMTSSGGTPLGDGAVAVLYVPPKLARRTGTWGGRGLSDHRHRDWTATAATPPTPTSPRAWRSLDRLPRSGSIVRRKEQGAPFTVDCRVWPGVAAAAVPTPVGAWFTEEDPAPTYQSFLPTFWSA